MISQLYDELVDRLRSASLDDELDHNRKVLKVVVLLHALGLRAWAHARLGQPEEVLQLIAEVHLTSAVKGVFQERREALWARYGLDAGGGFDRSREHAGGTE